MIKSKQNFKEHVQKFYTDKIGTNLLKSFTNSPREQELNKDVTCQIVHETLEEAVSGQSFFKKQPSKDQEEFRNYIKSHKNSTMYAEVASDHQSSDEMPSPDKINKSYYNQERKQEDQNQEKMFLAKKTTGMEVEILTDIFEDKTPKDEEIVENKTKEYMELELEAFPQTKKTSTCTGTDAP